MIREDFSVEPANWETDLANLRQVREQVFIIEQNVPAEEEWDALDAKSHHVLARDAQGQPIGTGRLTPEHVIGRVAVLHEWRGKRVGETIMRVLLEQARELRYPAIELHAQIHAIAFYERLGFAICSEEFYECGIAHRTMRLTLAPLSVERSSEPPQERPESRILSVARHAQAHLAVLELLKLSRHELAIYSRDLDADLLDETHVLALIKQIALSGRSAQVRILIQEPGKISTEGHRLVALAQRLPSAIAIRTPVEEEDLQYPSAFILNDAAGYFLRPLSYRYEGEGNTYDPGRHAQLLEYFNRVWERSQPSQELRQLAL